MEELKKKLQDIKKILSYMQGVNLIDSDIYKQINEPIEEAILLYNDNIIAIDNLIQEVHDFSFTDGIKYANSIIH